MTNLIGVFIFTVAVFVFLYVMRKLISDKNENENLWELCAKENPSAPGVYPVLFIVDEDGDYDEVTALAEWKLCPFGQSRWIDHCTGEPCTPHAFYVLPARNWHE